MVTYQEDPKDDAYLWAAAIILLLLFLFNAFRSQAAEKDTIQIPAYTVERIVKRPTTSGKSVKFYVVYNCGESKDLINVNRTTVEYIQMCKQLGIQPSLGLVIKNERAVSIVKINRRYDKKRRDCM